MIKLKIRNSENIDCQTIKHKELKSDNNIKKTAFG